MVLRMYMWDMDAAILVQERGVHYTVKLAGDLVEQLGVRYSVLGENMLTYSATTLKQASRFLLRACASSILPSFRVQSVLFCFKFESANQLVPIPSSTYIKGPFDIELSKLDGVNRLCSATY